MHMNHPTNRKAVNYAYAQHSVDFSVSENFLSLLLLRLLP